LVFWQVNVLADDVVREVLAQDGYELLQLLGVAGHKGQGQTAAGHLPMSVTLDNENVKWRFVVFKSLGSEKQIFKMIN